MSAREAGPEFRAGNHWIGFGHPTYFIADIAANHNGSLQEAKELIRLAKEAGADAAKFQHFRAEKIVSKYGFEALKTRLSHQSKWQKPVFEIYQDASVPWEWTEALAEAAKKEQIDFFSAPYDLEAIEMLDPYVMAYKVGSGDINWEESLQRMASKKKPVFLATGASTMKEVKRAVEIITAIHPQLCLMQCNTNYTGSAENLNHIHLNVLKTFSEKFPDLVLGLSDHTAGHATVLGAVALGARVVEKHFTRDRRQTGPDHPFSMDPEAWREMVDRTRELEMALGHADKTIAANEIQTALIQRRCCRAARDLKKEHVLGRQDIDVLRPVTPGAFLPSDIEGLIGKKLTKDLTTGEPFLKESIGA
ncbi:MAG TPA: N-acetylneuraminate synthase family protein [bacterium]|nr:N-acetylneuraminate synthase family protein [bacterium]